MALTPSRRARRRCPWLLLAVVTLIAASAAACGGEAADDVEGRRAQAVTGAGGSTGPSGTAEVAGATFSSGAITGFGSIIVNGVRFDDDRARVVAADGQVRSRDELKLGMIVAVDASPIALEAATGERRATATEIRYASEIKGPVDVVDPTTGQFALLGQLVQVTASTVFDPSLSGGITALVPGQVLEVHGHYVGEGRYRATRIDLVEGREDVSGGSQGTAPYELRGQVSAVDPAALTLRIGGANIDYSQVAAVPPLAAGDFIRADLARLRNAAGYWPALRLAAASPVSTGGVDRRSDGAGRGRGDGSEAGIEGHITVFESPISFSVNGVRIDASQVGDLPAGLAHGVGVEVEGRLVDAVLIAREVELDDEDGDDRGRESGRESGRERGNGSNEGQGSRRGIEIEGRIDTHDPAGRTFVIRGVTIRYGATVRYDDGSEAGLRPGARVEVEGRLAPDGVTVEAIEIGFDD